MHTEKGVRVELLLGGELPETLHQWLDPQKSGETINLMLEDYDQLAFVLQTLKYAHIEVKQLSLPETDLEDVFVKIMRK